MKWLLSLDPSGNFNEGKGVTGWCLFIDNKLKDAGQIYADKHTTQLSYWAHVISLITVLNRNEIKLGDTLTVICEDYRLYGDKAEAQINSNLETPQLIGAIKYVCWSYAIPLHLQMAHEVKTRWSDSVLKNTGLLIRKGKSWYANDILIEHHSKDAYRHGLHYITFKESVKQEQKKIELIERSNY